MRLIDARNLLNSSFPITHVHLKSLTEDFEHENEFFKIFFLFADKKSEKLIFVEESEKRWENNLFRLLMKFPKEEKEKWRQESSIETTEVGFKSN